MCPPEKPDKIYLMTDRSKLIVDNIYKLFQKY